MKTSDEQSTLMRSRMLSGDLYLSSDTELTQMRDRAAHILHRFNTAPSEAISQQQALIQELFGKLGSNFEIRPCFQCDYGSNIIAGDNLYINFDCVILDCNTVTLGDRVLLGPKVQIYTAAHPLDPEQRKHGWEYALPITIGNDVWIGGGAIICPGVSIGDDVTIGAGSVVTRDIPSRVVAVGNPCRVIRSLDDLSRK